MNATQIASYINSLADLLSPSGKQVYNAYVAQAVAHGQANMVIGRILLYISAVFGSIFLISMLCFIIWREVDHAAAAAIIGAVAVVILILGSVLYANGYTSTKSPDYRAIHNIMCQSRNTNNNYYYC